MKKILLIIGILISSVAFPQRNIPKGGTAGQVMKIASDGSNIAWSNLSDVATVVAPLVLTANTLSITANTFVQNSGNAVNVDLNMKQFNSVGLITQGSTTMATGQSALKQYGNYTNDTSYLGALAWYNTNATGDLRVAQVGPFREGSNNAGRLVFTTWNSSHTAVVNASMSSTGGTSFGGALTTIVDASAQVEIVSTTKGFLMPRMTAAQASLISSPANGLIVYVSDTDGTFTSVGFWGRVAGAWAKLNN